MTVRRLGLLLTSFALLFPVGAAHAASIWTPINSGTTDTISSVVYQSPTRFWYATTNGKIEYFNGGSFVAGTGPTAGENFTDLAFQPTSVPGGPGTSGLYGYAVTSSGHVWQTANGGVSWTPVAPPSTWSDCLADATVGVESELNAVVWANSSTVYLLGNSSTLEKTTNGNSPTPAFTEINKHGTGTCQAQSDSSAQNLTDAAFLPSNPLDGFMISQDFGSLYATSNGFASGVKKSEMVNNFQGSPRLAQDAANPNRLWAVDHSPGGGGCGELCLQFSTDGGITDSHATFPNDSTPSVGLYDVSSQGGTEVAVGSGGEIFNSIDGKNFYLQPAGGSLGTENWRAEDAFDATHAAVGGEGGALAVTAEANVIKSPLPLPPTGSDPTTTSTGAATVTIYKRVVVTNRTPRYVPVKVSVSQPRRIVAAILTFKGKHRVAAAQLTVKRHGRRTLHVGLNRRVKPGKYFMVIRVLTTKGHPLGHLIRVTIRLI